MGKMVIGWWFHGIWWDLPSGKRWHNCGKIMKDPPCWMGQLTNSMAMFNSYVKLPDGNSNDKDNDSIIVIMMDNSMMIVYES